MTPCDSRGNPSLSFSSRISCNTKQRKTRGPQKTVNLKGKQQNDRERDQVRLRNPAENARQDVHAKLLNVWLRDQFLTRCVAGLSRQVAFLTSSSLCWCDHKKSPRTQLSFYLPLPFLFKYSTDQTAVYNNKLIMTGPAT